METPSKEELEFLLKEYKTLRAIAKVKYVSPTTANVWYKRMGIPNTWKKRVNDEEFKKYYTTSELSVEQMAEMWDISPVSVYERARNLGVSRPNANKKITISDKEFTKIYMSDMCYKDVCKALDMGTSSISKIATRLGLKRPAPNKSMPIPAREELLRVVREKPNSRDIANHFNVCKSTMFKWLRLYKISIKEESMRGKL